MDRYAGHCDSLLTVEAAKGRLRERAAGWSRRIADDAVRADAATDLSRLWSAVRRMEGE